MPVSGTACSSRSAPGMPKPLSETSAGRTRALLRRLLCIPALAAALASGACSWSGIANALVPEDGFTLSADIEYGELPRQALDIYRPRGWQSPRPVIVFFYGGRWQRGSKDTYKMLAYTLTEQGYVVVVPDYRLYPAVEFPGFVEDAALAVRWVQRNAARYGGDPARVVLMGHSAGAHIALLLTLDERYLRGVDVESAEAIAGTVGLAGPYDFLPFTDQDVRDVMGPPDGWEQTQPVNFADGNEPPVLLLQGAGDETVKPRNAERLAARIEAEGGCARTAFYPGVGHIEIVVALIAAPIVDLAPVLSDVVRFVESPGCGGGSSEQTKAGTGKR